jgi:hypothetical protein
MLTNAQDKKLKLYAIVAIFAVFVIAPSLAFSSHNKSLYVNAKANGMEDGSRNHPYKTIGSAIDKADSNTEIHVSKGEYVENITLKKGIKLFGEDADNTILKAKKDKWSTVYMADNSEIDDFTITRGDRGIWVGKHAKVNIINCIVKYNDGDGIGVEGDGMSKSNQVYISKTEIRNNNQAGIYVAGSRRIVVMDSDIYDNSNDGIDLPRATSAYLAGNSIKNNGGSGLIATIDGSDIWTKNNSIRDNNREGMEVSFYGGSGRINVAKAKFVGNDRYAVARLQKAGTINSVAWDKYLTFDKNTYFASNGLGNISRILRAN